MKSRCPYCKSELLTRKRRKPWMRLIPETKRYDCNNCRGEFITILGFVKFPVEKRFSTLANKDIQ